VKMVYGSVKPGGSVAPSKRVAVIAYAEYWSDPRVRREAEVLAGQGYFVCVIAMRPKSGSSSVQMKAVQLYELPLTVRRGGKARYLYQYLMFFILGTFLLLELHLRYHFAVIHVHSLPDFLVFSTIPERLMGAQVVLDLHEAMPEILAARFGLPMSNLWVRVARVLEWASSLYATHVIAVSPLRAQLIAGRGIDPRHIAVIPNSPDTTSFRVYPEGKRVVQDSFEGRWLLVEAGGINPERDLETLVRAAGILSKSHPVSLVLFGKGEPAYVQRLRDLASRESSDVDFRLGGWVPTEEVARYLSMSAVGLATYERNPLTEFAAPNKVFECAALRVPLVLADLRALRYEWKDAALFYQPGNPEDLALRVRQVIETPELRARLVSKALEVYSHNDWTKSRLTLLHLFESLAGPRGD
jgi:glycosyltransferase involved in cell wall biosynthesis